jgi:putative copper resistance protein D
MTEYLIASKLIHLAAVMVLFGSSLFRLYIGGAACEALGIFDRRLRKLLLVAASAALISVLAWWDSVAVTIGEGWPDAWNREVLADVLFETEFGRIWIWRLVLSAILLGTLIQFRRFSSGSQLGIVVVFAGALLLSLAPIGHAAHDTGIPQAAQFGAKALHLAAAALWLGGLVPLGYVLGRARNGEAEWVSLARHVLPRFSLVGYFAVSLILLSGCIIGWFHVGSWAALVGTLYGHVLLVKLGLFLLMIGIALFNRLRLAPPVVEGAVPPIAALWKSVVVEQAVGLSILLAASILATLPPAHGI